MEGGSMSKDAAGQAAAPSEILGASLTEEQAREIYRQGEESVVFALLTMARKLAALQPTKPAPTTPSGMIPPYQKPPATRRRKRPGQKAGHPGNHRPPPERIDQRQEHRLPRCPHCGGRLRRCTDTRTRYIEDIPHGIRAVVTEHVIHRDWCPHCRKKVEPVVSDALPGAALGNRTLVLSAWLHYGLGNTLSQIVDVFNYHLQLKLTPGGLVQMWYRLQEVLYPWYQQLQAEALASAVLHGDETSWRVAGKTHWLWCFANEEVTYYLIDRSRGEPALRKFFIEEFAGTLVSDFWGAYNAVVCAARQGCLVHLLRDLETVDRYARGGQHWAAFAKKLRRLVGDAIRLWRQKADIAAEVFASRRQRLEGRLDELIETPWEDKQAKRLIKRLRRHRHDLFTFLDKPGVPFDNNLGERAIRPAVIIRKNSYANRSQRGADAQAVLMSIYRTLKQRGHNPLDTITEAIATYLKTGQLPTLPPKIASDG
jgi:transposase